MSNAMDIIDITIKDEWPNWEDYSLKQYFTKIATLIPNQKKEKIEVKKDFDPRYKTIKGLCYAFVIGGKFIKQGKTESTMAERIKSYNCGKKKYRGTGTCSVSNYKCLQSMLAINKPIEIYAFFAPPIHFELFGKEIETTVSPAKYIENMFNEKAQKEFNGKLPWCIQK